MRTINFAIVRSVFTLLIGILLVARPNVAVGYLVIVIGVLFMLPGMYGLFSYFFSSGKRSDGSPVNFPIAALGSTLLGMWLMVSPMFFVSILMYVLGVLLVMGGLSQVMSFVAVRRYASVPMAVFFIPVLILLAGLLVLFNPFEAASVPFVVLGVSAIIYALTDLARLVIYRRKVRAAMDEMAAVDPDKADDEVEDVVVIEEIKDRD